ncbi:MAG TPA: bifunctional hydroxymethylpyrimidine kinase/phosphomethylpyrimidine kinase [Catenuloplanes sp.]|jgi:hydroxymethylpyrimidine kinase/phosphomethylpyrimidine kinase
MTPPVALTIAGSDAGGGAGIQADLKVFAALRAYGASAVTAVTSQNYRGMRDVYGLPTTVVDAQLDAVLDGLPVGAVKAGMLATADVAGVVAARARAGLLPNLVVDPVLTASSGRRQGLVKAIERILPFALVATPNREEASALVGWQVATPADMAGAAAQIASNGPKYVVVTGGDMVSTGDEALDALWTDTGATFLRFPRVVTRNTYGAGSTFSAAIAARLALGDDVPTALAFAKQYVAQCLTGAQQWKLSARPGPLDHFGWSL